MLRLEQGRNMLGMTFYDTYSFSLYLYSAINPK
ncbi:hypothetical protein ABIB60_001199 [Hymenobacter sp. UYP22]